MHIFFSSAQVFDIIKMRAYVKNPNVYIIAFFCFYAAVTLHCDCNQHQLII